MKFNRTFIVTGGAIAFVIIGIAASKPPQEKFKNLKVLPKDTKRGWGKTLRGTE